MEKLGDIVDAFTVFACFRFGVVVDGADRFGGVVGRVRRVAVHWLAVEGAGCC